MFSGICGCIVFSLLKMLVFVNRGIKKREKTVSKPCRNFKIFILHINKVYLVVRADKAVSGQLCRHIDRRIEKSLVALRRDTLNDDHILVLLDKRGIYRRDILPFYRLGEVDHTALDRRGSYKRNCALDRLGEEKPLTLGVYNEAGGHLKSEGGERFGE